MDEGETRLASDPGGVAARPPGAPLGALAPGDLFGPRYRILRVLGAGGMGIVYHAWDEELGIAVALKVIRPEVSADPATAKELEKRFKRELLLARQVTHHNVVRIHDIGEVERTKYITMSFIDGRDLATELKASGHLTVSKTLLLIRQLAEGLQAAHAAGVIHRDLKPANIMVEGDTPVIMDFGIARSAVRPVEGNVMQGTMPLSRSALVTGATMQGAIVGTVAYMSPEQAKGQPADQRSDIYAVGMIMRDMLVGMRDVENPTDAMNELMERVEHAPKPVGEIDPSIPPDVDRIVTRCLQPEAAARYQSVEELLKDLNALDAEGKRLPILRQFSQRTIGAIGLLVVLLLGGTWYLARGPGVPVEIAPVSVLVADFDNQTGDAAFEGALEQALVIAMEGASYVRVFPQQTARRIAQQTVPDFSGRIDPAVGQLISRREGLKVLLAGGIARDGNGYRLSLRATDPATGADITTAEREVDDKGEVLAGVAEMAEDIRAELGESRSDMEKVAAAETFTAASLDAMREYARGQAQLNAGNYQDALAAYDAALKYDPQLGRAYASIGTIYVNLKQTGKADANFKQALKLLDRMTPRERYRTQAGYFLGVAGNTGKAIENFEALIKEFPADDVAYGNLALAYLRAMNVQKAKEVAAKGLELYPQNLLQRTNYAAYALYAADFDTAIKEGETVLKANPKYEFPYLPIALAYAATGRLPEAEATYGRLRNLSPTGASLAVLGLADLDLFRGLKVPAIAKLREGITADEKAENPGEMAIKEVALAEALLATGRKAQAAATAKRALQHGRAVNVQVSAALVLIDAGDTAGALAVAKDLENRLQNETTGYARLIQGVVALSRNDLLPATEALGEAVKRHDSWLARYYRGLAYFASDDHVAEAAEEWERCYVRRGESADLFFLDSPSLRYLPPMLYWLGRAREALGTTASAQSAYKEYLKIRGDAAGDPLVADARRRLDQRTP